MQTLLVFIMESIKKLTFKDLFVCRVCNVSQETSIFLPCDHVICKVISASPYHVICHVISASPYHVICKVISASYHVICQVISASPYHVICQVISASPYHVICQVISASSYHVICQVISASPYHMIYCSQECMKQVRGRSSDGEVRVCEENTTDTQSEWVDTELAPEGVDERSVGKVTGDRELDHTTLFCPVCGSHFTEDSVCILMSEVFQDLGLDK